MFIAIIVIIKFINIQLTASMNIIRNYVQSFIKISTSINILRFYSLGEGREMTFKKL